MLRSSLYTVGALLLSTSAFAQTDASSKLHPITTQVKQGPTYHAATKTWTRRSTPTASLTGKVLYDNTCLVGFYVGMDPNESLVDEGRLPSTTATQNPPVSYAGKTDAYTVTAFDIGYCTQDVALDIIMAHWDCWAGFCGDQTALNPAASALLIGSPPSTAFAGSLACWIVGIDLKNSTFEFDLLADCSGAQDTQNRFAWEILLGGAASVTGPAGPLLAGDPFALMGNNCPFGAGAYYHPNAGPGTGLATDDVFTSYNPGPAATGGTFAGCWFFGGYTNGFPYASFYHLVEGTNSSTTCAVSEYCNGDGSGTACPFGNNNNGSNGIAGCANSVSAGGSKLTFTGCTTSNDLVLVASPVPTAPGVFFQGNNAVNGGLGIQSFDGLRCAGGGIIRLQRILGGQVINNTAMTTVNIASAGGVTPGSGAIRRYQYWFRDVAFGLTGSNLTNGLEAIW